MTPVFSEPVRISIGPSLSPKQPFLGFGFHVFFPVHEYDDRIRDEVLFKRWRELRPSFARVTHRWSDGPEGEGRLIETLRMMKSTGTLVYLTTWDPMAYPEGESRERYASEVAEMLERLYRAGCTNVRWYCMTNELSLTGQVGEKQNLKGWASLRKHKQIFADYHRLIHSELEKRNLNVGLLSMDASPDLGVEEARWAKNHIPEISSVYGGHHYLNHHHPEKSGTYKWFYEKSREAVAVDPDKPFIIGEFGAKQHRGARFGYEKWDGCAWYDTPAEPWVTLQVGEAVLASVNAGVAALGYWTFSDFPDSFTKDRRYINKWGTSQWSGEDHTTRDLHYGLALLTRYFRGPGSPLTSTESDPLVYTAAIGQKNGSISVAVLNRNRIKKELWVEGLPQTNKPYRCYRFEIDKAPQHPFGDLPGPDAERSVADGVLKDEIPPLSLVVYTTDYEKDLPLPVPRILGIGEKDESYTLSWEPSPDPDVAYYRVFAGEKQLGSTIATRFTLLKFPQSSLSIHTVDTSGNVSVTRQSLSDAKGTKTNESSL